MNSLLSIAIAMYEHVYTIVGTVRENLLRDWLMGPEETNTVYVGIVKALLCLIAAMTFTRLVVHILNMRQFYALPFDQVGGFTLEGLFRRLYETIVCFVITFMCLCIIFIGSIGGINITNKPGDTEYLSRWVIFGCNIYILMMTLFIFSGHRIIYREIARRTSILYLIGRHPSITHHNADVFCDQFGLDVFPVKIFERLHREKPTLTLHDLEKVITNAQSHIDFMTVVKDTSAHLRCLQPVIGPTQC